MIATGCEDKNVRVFYLATTSDQPLKVFSGESKSQLGQTTGFNLIVPYSILYYRGIDLLLCIIDVYAMATNISYP